MTRGPLLVAVILASSPAYADEDARRFGLGVEFGVVGTPQGHLGIPVQGTEDGIHIPGEIVFRWQAGSFWAVNAGLGLAHAAIGPTVRGGVELFKPLLKVHENLMILEAYTDPGLVLGFAGPDYFARQENAFVGYGYVVNGPLSFGPRLPVGIRLRWPRARLDTFVEAISILTVTPAVEQFFELGVGVRVRW